LFIGRKNFASDYFFYRHLNIDTRNRERPKLERNITLVEAIEDLRLLTLLNNY